jgi:hypothetical protein
MTTRKGRNSRANALVLASKIKSIRSYVDDGVGWVEILFKDKCELAIRFEVAPAVVKKGFLVQYSGGNAQLIKRYKIAREYPAGELS